MWRIVSKIDLKQESEIEDLSVTFLIGRLLAAKDTILTYLVKIQIDPSLNFLNLEDSPEKIKTDLIKLQDFSP